MIGERSRSGAGARARLALVGCAAALAGLCAGVALPAPALGAKSSGAVFRLDARGARLLPAEGGSMRLVLRRPSGPVRIRAGKNAELLKLKTATAFARSWKDYGFDREPPVAAIRDLGAPRYRDVLLARLSEPRTLAGGGVSFAAEPVGGEPAPRSLARLARRGDGALDPSPGRASALVAAGETENLYAEIDWDLPANWGASFTTPLGPTRLIQMNPFTGSAFFGQATGSGWMRFGFGSGPGGTGFLVLQAAGQGSCLQLAMDSDQPYTSLELEVGTKPNLANSNSAPMNPGVNEVCA